MSNNNNNNNYNKSDDETLAKLHETKHPAKG
jgi:hypothetical protein